jgi:hypothetical protein
MANEQINQLAALGLPVLGTDKLIVQRGAARATALEIQNSGLVTGPAVATDGAVVLYDGVTGKLIKNGVLPANLITGGVTFIAVPATPTSAGTAGQMAVSAFHLYICTALNTWRRVAIGSW